MAKSPNEASQTACSSKVLIPGGALELTRSDTHKSLNVCICLPDFIGSKLNFGPMLVDTFSQIGCQADLVDDGDVEALQADILLLAGNCSHFVKFPRLLSRHKGPRPKTILWQLEPFGPPEMTDQAEKIGLKMAMLNRKNQPRICARLIKATVPSHRKLKKFIKEILVKKFIKEMAAQNQQDYSNLDVGDLSFIMDQHRWLKKRYSQSWCDFVFASTIPRCRLLNNMGIPAGYVPVGYHKGWGQKLETIRDIDVLFIGYANTKPRLSALKTIQQTLANKGINLVIESLGCYGQQRTELLNRTRIVLDIIRLPWEMPVMRLLMSMACGALVISNWTGEPVPFTKEHFVQTDTQNLAEAIIYYLKNENQRQNIADSAHKFITEKLTLQNSVLQILTGSNADFAIEESKQNEQIFNSNTSSLYSR